ncbi:hypothetical protein BCR33DRAFT_715494, partial [Rhizoclosmatium globosum]
AQLASIASSPKWPSDLDVAWLSWKTDQADHLSSVYAQWSLYFNQDGMAQGLVTKPRKSHLKRRIPSSIILVTKLTHLNLSMPIPNGLPDSITTSHSPKTNSLENSTIPSALILFTANRNNLTGPLPETLPSTLDHLDIPKTVFTGHIPASMCALTSLTHLIYTQTTCVRRGGVLYFDLQAQFGRGGR